MDLLSLPGHTLRLYLHLLARGQRISLDAASCRGLSRQSGLDRRTIPASLARLQEAGMIDLQEQTCVVDPTPLAALLAGNAGTSMHQPEVDNCLVQDQGGTSMRHPKTAAGTSMRQGGTFMRHPRSGTGTSMHQGGRIFRHPAGPSTPARTSWPSLQEGSSCTTPPSIPPPADLTDQDRPAGKGGLETQAATAAAAALADPWLVAMRQLWQRIAPAHPHDPDWWLRYLRRNYGAEIPLAVLTQFAEGGHTLAQLEHPQFYRAWFETQCSERGRRHLASGASVWLRRRQEETAHRTGPTSRTPAPAAAPGPVPLGAVLAEAVPAGASPRPAAATEAAEARHRPTPSPLTSERTQPSKAARSRPPSIAAYRQDLQAVYQATRDRAWPSPHLAEQGRSPRSRRTTPVSLPPATGPPVAPRPAYHDAV